MSDIAAVDLRYHQIPLSEPYRLSHTTVEAFDTIVVSITTDDGECGFGEVTTLKGYSATNARQAWKLVTEKGASLLGASLREAQTQLRASLGDDPFVLSAFDCALKTVGGIGAVRAPVVGILSTDAPVEHARESLDEQLKQGFETIKVKIGFEPERDAKRLSTLVEAAPDDIAFRVDANQGYSLDEARSFLDAAPADRLQHIEQPLSVGKLTAHRRLRREYTPPVVLDEELQDAADLDLVIRADAADGVKFKLMKAGGWDATREAMDRAQAAGLDVVLGNGVQSDLGCIHEACIWDAMEMDLAGEFNGWRKQRRGLVDGGLSLVGGQLVWDGSPVALESGIDDYVLDSRRFD